MATGDYRQSWERVPEGPKPEGPPVFTPTTEEVRDQWVSSPIYGYQYPMPVQFADFDRWLASVRADAWDEGFNAADVFHAPHDYDWNLDNPYRSEKQ